MERTLTSDTVDDAAPPGAANLPIALFDDVEPAQELVRVCLVCGATMVDRGCKLRCPRCHYFASCSDYL